ALSRLSGELEARVRAQTAELARRAESAEALYEVSRALTGTLDLPTVLGLIAEPAIRLLKFDSALVLLAQDEAEGEPSFAVVSGDHEPPALVGALLTQERALHEVHERRRPAVIQLPRAGSEPASALVLPMVYGTSVAGVLVLIGPGGAARRGC